MQSGSPEPRSRFRGGWALAIVLPLVLVLGSQERREEFCRDCLSRRSGTNWGLGAYDRAPLLTIAPNSQVTVSRTCQALFDAGHVHAWAFLEHRLMGFPGLLYPLTNYGDDRNAFGRALERSDRLLGFVKEEVRAGRVSLAEVVQMIRLHPTRPYLDSPSDRLARERALGWMRTHAPECPTYFMDGSRYEALPDGSFRIRPAR